jgi:UDP:flavonoid glycosyltransferase YjiC (YdhE family)
VLSTASTTPVLAALAHGLPHVLVPVGGEGPVLAARVAEAGCGLRLDAETLDAATLRAAVERAFAPGPLRDASRAMGEAFARMPGFGAAADRLERLGRTGAPVLRPAEDAVIPAPPRPQRAPARAA